MYITLAGIGKIMFVLGLRILLICKSLNFIVAFNKKKTYTFQSLLTVFRVRKLISVYTSIQYYHSSLLSSQTAFTAQS